MNNLTKKIISFVFAVFALLTCFTAVSSAASEWTYADKLPSGITSEKYTIQYKHTYRTTAKEAPGSAWEQKGYSHTAYENKGSPYWSTIELSTSSTRELVSYHYYHWCGSGIHANYCQSGSFVHYDWIAASQVYVVASYTDADNSAYKYYELNFNGGGRAYCQSGITCDGSNGTHGQRSCYWYRNSQYQDKVAVAMYTYEKESKWEDKKDGDATEYRVRYKLKHTHSYPTEWKVSKKATFTEDGTKYKTCKTCGYKKKVTIRKVSKVKLAKSTFTYNGEVKKPSVTVKDSKGETLPKSKYKVSYANAGSSIGKHKVTVTLDSKYYKSSKSLTYKINPAKVTGVKASPVKDGVALKWNASGGGVSYRIYSYNKTTKKIDYIKTVSGTSCTISSLKSSKVYRYVIKGSKAVGGSNYYGNKSEVVSCRPYGRPEDVKNVRISKKTDSSVTLKWNEAAGNNVLYYVFRYNKSTGKYTQIAKTSNLKYTVKDLKADTTYRFAVEAFSPAGSSGYFSAVSPVLTVKTYKKLVAPEVTGVKLSTEGKLSNVLITWTAKSTATGYKIYRSTSGKSGTYTKIATITDPTVSSYNDTTVSAAKKYYYRIRSYRTRGEQTVHSDFSSKKSIVTYSAWTERLTRNDLYFNFYNWSGDFNYPEGYVIPLYSFQLLYGNTELASKMYDTYNSLSPVWGGSCHGMCSTSAMFNVRTSGLTPAMFNAAAQKPHQLVPSSLGSLGIPLYRVIEAMQVSQIDSVITYGRVWNNMDSLMQEIMKTQQTGKPVIIGVRRNDSGHALLAYDYYWADSSTINVRVYDPNYKSADRNFVFKVDANGYLTHWYYCINDELACGTGYSGSQLEYLTYDTYASLWTNSVSANNSQRSQTNTLIVNSQDIEIYNSNNKLVATMRDGVISDNAENIAVASPTDVIRTDDTPSIIYLPSDDTYTVVNIDSDVNMFEATMVNVDRSADVSTEADAITFTVNDEKELNCVSVDAEDDESYNIVLDSSECVDEEKIEIVGNGNGSTVSTVQIDGETELVNCVEADVYVGEDGNRLSENEVLEMMP